MKHKFYENPPSLSFETWPENSDKDTFSLFWNEINWISKNSGLDVMKFRIDNITFGDPVVFYNGKYRGYLLNDFYLAYDTDDWQSWYGRIDYEKYLKRS